MPPAVVVRTIPPTHAVAQRVLRTYLEEVAGRWYGRPATAAEVDQALREDPSDHLRPPGGLFLVACGAGPDAEEQPLGCAALQLVTGTVAEVKRVFVLPSARRRGVATALMDALEQHARRLGVSSLRLDTRQDLVEALGLYERRGYRDVPAFNEGPYAERWLAKQLSAPSGDG